MTRAGVGYSAADNGAQAGADAVEAALISGGLERADAVLLFASAHYEGQFGALVEAASRVADCNEIVGCSTVAVIAGPREYEGDPGVAALVVESNTLRFTSALIEGADVVLTPSQLADDLAHRIARFAGADEGDDRLLVLFSDPLTLHAPRLFSRLAAVASLPVLGGAASRGVQSTHTHQWGVRVSTGKPTVGVAALSVLVVSGATNWHSIVTHACKPIGEALIVTEVAGAAETGNVIRRIAGQPAAEVLREVLEQLPASARAELHGGVFIGIALDESKLGLSTGDYLVRNLTGIDPIENSLGVGDLVREGQTVQFQLRTRAAAQADLKRRLADLVAELGSSSPAFALYLNCLGRGRSLLRVPDHDAVCIQAALGALPLAGMFTNSEFAALSGRNLMHNYSGVLGVFCEGKRRPD